jgi:uncharacterized protein (DUF4213/DUF364 family)
MSVLREAIGVVENQYDIDSLNIGKIVVGLAYIGVMFTDGDVGICSNLIAESNPHCCDIIDEAGRLTDIPVRRLLAYTTSWNFFERALGVATLNALSQKIIRENPEDYPMLRGNLINVIDVEPGERVSLVGMIRPFIPTLEDKAKELYILERGSPRPQGVYPDTACEELLPLSDVVVITGSAIANGTLDRLLELSTNARTVAVVGPTASMVPDPLFSRGVDYCGGIQVKNPELLMKILSEAGGTPHMRGEAVDFVTYLAPE